MSKASILFITVSTFIVGFFSGVYIYFFTGGPAKYGFDITPQSSAYVITVEEYGQCEVGRTCGSYRIDASGIFTGLLLHDTTSQRVDEQLSSAERKRLRDAIGRADWETLVAKRSVRCTQKDEAFFVSVQLKEVKYVFHVCGQAAEEGELIGILREYRNILRS